MSIARGLVAGAAGTLTLKMLTYLDMAARGRPASTVPAETAQQLVETSGGDLAPGGDDDVRENRGQALGALLGYASGLGFAALYGALRDRTAPVPRTVGGVGLALAAMVGANGPATAMGVTDPREWGAEGWVSDVVPHLAYGLVTAGVYDAIGGLDR
jgi:drug/metabolite transporter (DMT)-like permease